MTSNQLAYWRDYETRRSNIAEENLKKYTLRENERHNRITEDYDRLKTGAQWKNALNEENKIRANLLGKVGDWIFGGLKLH